MRALVVKEQHAYAVEQVRDPRIGPYDALVKMETCGFCNSTDIKLIEGLMDWAPPFPILLGHESVGRVVELGNKVRKFAVGDLVTRPIAWFEPDPGDPNSAFGGFAELGVVRDADAMKGDGDDSFVNDYNALRQNVLPDGLDAVQGALCISLAETASSLAYLPQIRGRKVVVVGTGVAGLSFTLWAAMAGAEVLSIGRREERLMIARQLGAAHCLNTSSLADDTSLAVRHCLRGPADVVIDAVGDVELAGSLEHSVGPDGVLSAYGVPASGNRYSDRWSVARVEEHKAYQWVARMVTCGLVDLNIFLTHVWGFEEIERLIGEVSSRRVLKGMVRF